MEICTKSDQAIWQEVEQILEEVLENTYYIFRNFRNGGNKLLN